MDRRERQGPLWRPRGGARRVAVQAIGSAAARSEKKSVAVNPARVGAACKGLIDKIAAVVAGQNWERLYREFNSACPGIAYECVEYGSSPKYNQCNWIERKGSNVLSHNRFP